MHTITKADIINALNEANFELDGRTDYVRIVEFVKHEFNKKLTNQAVWAVINELKHEDLEELDFN